MSRVLQHQAASLMAGTQPLTWLGGVPKNCKPVHEIIHELTQVNCAAHL